MEQTRTHETKALPFDYDVPVSINPDLDWHQIPEQATEEDRTGFVSTPPCPRCGSTHGQWRGYRQTRKTGTIHRRTCNACGRWHTNRQR